MADTIGHADRRRGGDAVRVQAVSHEFFPVLRVAPMLGRVISREDDRPKAPLSGAHQPSPLAEPVRR